MEKALLFWQLGRDNLRVISHYYSPLGLRYAVIPSKIGDLHPSGTGLIREKLPEPGHAELVVLELKDHLRTCRSFYVAYPFRNETYPLPGITEPLWITPETDDDLLTTFVIGPKTYVRIFKGRKQIKYPKSVGGHDVVVYDNSIRTDCSGQVPCWVTYQMTGARPVGYAYPSRAFQEKQYQLVTKDLPRIVRIGAKRREHEIVVVPADGHCRVKIMAREGKFNGPKIWVRLIDGSETFLFMSSLKTQGLLENTMYSGEVVSYSSERKWVELLLDAYLGLPPLPTAERRKDRHS